MLVIPAVAGAEVIDDEPEVVALYAKGKRMMREEDWLEASKIFGELAGRFESSSNLDLFLFNRAKAQYYFGEYDKAIAGFTFFIRKYPESPNTPYAVYFRGNSSYLSGQSTRAVRDYLQALAISTDARLDNLAIGSMETAFKNASSVKFGPPEFEALPPAKKCRLVPKLAAILQSRGEMSQAQSLMDLCGIELDNSQYPAGMDGRSRTGFEVALLLPFSGEMRPFADDIYNGAIIAAEMLRSEDNLEIKIVPYDTQGDAIDAARIASELIASRQTGAIVGPLTSDEAAVVSATMGKTDLPLLIPAATQAGLTQLSSSSFQLSPNIELQGIRMAEYAVNVLGADTAAIITPTSADHLRMARAFTRRFEQLGGMLLAVEYYRPRDNDFGKQIRDIKGMFLGFPPDSTFIVNETGDTLDVDEQPVRLDCLFLPGDPEVLRQLIPQVIFYNLNAKLLGSDGWGGDPVLKLEEKITGEAVFPSPFISTGSGEEYFDFAAQYDKRYSDQPPRLATLGFDAIRLIGIAMHNNKKSRSEIVAWLKNISKYDGASGRISFGENRENNEMPLYRIKLNQAINLEYLLEENVQPETEN